MVVGETAVPSNRLLVALRRPQWNWGGKKSSDAGKKLRRREHLIPTAERGEGRGGGFGGGSLRAAKCQTRHRWELLR